MNYQETTYQTADTFNQFLTKTFTIMTMGLLLTAGVAYFIAAFMPQIVYSYGMTMFVIIAQLGVCFYFSARFMNMSVGAARICFIAYSVLTGITFSFIPLIYDGGTLALAFTMTAVVFASMAIIGHTTSMDLSKFGPYFFAGLIAIIVTTLLNVLFFRSESIDLMLNYAGIIIFLGLIAFDMQNLRKIYLSGLNSGDMGAKLAIFGALQLYLDFINLFIRILAIFGRHSDN